MPRMNPFVSRRDHDNDVLEKQQVRSFVAVVDLVLTQSEKQYSTEHGQTNWREDALKCAQLSRLPWLINDGHQVGVIAGHFRQLLLLLSMPRCVFMVQINMVCRQLIYDSVVIASHVAY